MNGENRRFAFFVASLPALLMLAGCGKVHDGKAAEGAPPPAGVVPEFDASLFRSRVERAAAARKMIRKL